MGDEIRYLQSELAAILDQLRDRHRGLDLRVGFVFYRDLGDDYVTATVPLGHDFAAAQGELAAGMEAKSAEFRAQGSQLYAEPGDAE